MYQNQTTTIQSYTVMVLKKLQKNQIMCQNHSTNIHKKFYIYYMPKLDYKDVKKLKKYQIMCQNHNTMIHKN